MPLTNQHQRGTQEPTYTYGYPADPYYVVLPPAPIDPWRRRRRVLGYGALIISLSLLVVAAVYFLWPSQPTMQVEHIHFDNFNFNIVPQSGSIIPRLFLNLSVGMEVKVQNRDYYEMEYDSVNMGIGYRGRWIGSVSSESGRLSARCSTHVNATLDLDGVEVLHDVPYLIEDLDKGELPLDSLTEFNGRIKVWFVSISLQEVASCEVVLNPSNQTIISHDCGFEEGVTIRWAY